MSVYNIQQAASVQPALLMQKQVTEPALVGWNRLEPRTRTADFARSLKAEIRDALWMISRQWQVGEFRGDDAGSPVEARILTHEQRVNRYAAAGRQAEEMDDDALPMETSVEREAMPDSLQLKIQISTQFWKLYRHYNAPDAQRQKIKDVYTISLPEDMEEQHRILSNAGSLQLFDQATLKSIDGTKLYADIDSGSFQTWINAFADTELAAADKTTILQAATALHEWYNRVYSVPAANSDDPWNSKSLEYQFNCAAPADGGQTVLVADQYTSGHLDWYSFDIDKTTATLTDKTGAGIDDTDTQQEKLISFIPSGIRFGGMPNARYWQMEDSKTDFGDIDANTTDISKLLIAEFGLTGSDDWFLFPYTMEAGNICEIKGMLVTDTFGDRHLVSAAGKSSDDDWQSWQLYNMSVKGTGGETDNRLVLIPALVKSLESEPLEQVNFIRDEVANMVWAVETKISLPSGDTMNGVEAARELSAYLADGVTPVSTDLDAPVKYTLGTTVPENWIPFLSVHVDGDSRQTQLQRAAMPRTTGEADTYYIIPRTQLLAGSDPYYVYEEEVPRSGTELTKTFQRARWYNGKVITWVGKKVNNGRGQGNSGLRFDAVDPVQ